MIVWWDDFIKLKSLHYLVKKIRFFLCRPKCCWKDNNTLKTFSFIMNRYSLKSEVKCFFINIIPSNKQFFFIFLCTHMNNLSHHLLLVLDLMYWNIICTNSQKGSQCQNAIFLLKRWVFFYYATLCVFIFAWLHWWME